ncbi:MAG: hypothetical protein K2N64_02560 [Anaeroplasmataceae bacterium]|nr:hypothetical protein [Anaeroplasmataceae bacterium]
MIIEISPDQSITEAIKQLNPKDVLVLNDGIYNEKVEIWNSNITIKAKNYLKAKIIHKDYYHKIMPDNNECNTFRTYTLYVGGDYVKLEGLDIQNEAVPSCIYGQAVALHVDGNHFLCEQCRIASAQDSLFTGPMPSDLLLRYEGFYPPEKRKGTPSKQIYRQCTIIGDVDFIFGCATAFFDQCKIISLDRGSTNPTYVCAPAHSKELSFGYLFYKCSFQGNEPAYLARPWRDYGCVAFIECKLDEHILPEGYNKWDNTHRDKTARFYEYSTEIDTSRRVSWAHLLSSADATKYLNKFLSFLEENDEK